MTLQRPAASKLRLSVNAASSGGSAYFLTIPSATISKAVQREVDGEHRRPLVGRLSVVRRAEPGEEMVKTLWEGTDRSGGALRQFHANITARAP